MAEIICSLKKRGSSGGTTDISVNLMSYVTSGGGQGCIIPAKLIKNANLCTIAGGTAYSSSSTPTNDMSLRIYKTVNGVRYYLNPNNTWTTTDSNIYGVNSGTIQPGVVFATINLSNLTEIANADYARLYCSRASNGNVNVNFTFS